MQLFCDCIFIVIFNTVMFDLQMVAACNGAVLCMGCSSAFSGGSNGLGHHCPICHSLHLQ